MGLWIATKSKLASYIYRQCVVSYTTYTLSRPNNKWSVRSFAARSGTDISKRSLNMETNSNKIEKTLRATEGQFYSPSWGSEKNYWRWDHHFIRSSKSLEGPAGYRLTRPQSSYLDRTQRTELEKCAKGARGVMGRRKAKRNEWIENMSGLQGEDSFFISKLF